MARGVNKVILVGNVGRDPEVKYTGGGLAVVDLSIATSESWKDKTTGDQKERTEWHKVKFFGRLAEIVGEYVEKGRQLYVEGSLRTDSYEKDGATKYVTYIVGSEMQMLGGGSGERREQRSPARQGGQQGQGQRQAAPAQRRDAPPPDDFEDDIPFS